MKKEKLLLAEQETNLIQGQFTYLKDTFINYLLDLKEDTELAIEEQKFISSIKVLFEDNKNNHSLAYAVITLPDFDFDYLEDLQIVFNVNNSNDYYTTIIHEIAHIIYAKYCTNTNLTYNGYHCLEFAIITYCLYWKFLSKNNKYNTTFFRAYDIHEDIAYQNLSINVCKFDSLIKCIEFTTIKDLAIQAQKLAKRIRKNLV